MNRLQRSPRDGTGRRRPLLLLTGVLVLVPLVAAGTWLAVRGGEPFRGAGIVAYPEGCRDIDLLDLSWYYTWDHDNSCDEAGAEFVPMVWGDWCDEGSDCAALPQAIAASGSDTVLGFNEPDWTEQADLSVDRALELWSYLDATPLRLGSPAVTTGPRGFRWLEEFMERADEQGLRVDFVAAHWYGDCTSSAELSRYVTDLHYRFHRPVWLTEFACKESGAGTSEQFMRAAIADLQRMDAVERVAWFSNRPYPGYESSALADEAGLSTGLGDTYRQFDSERRNGFTSRLRRAATSFMQG